MALRIEDYALIGNMHTAALVGIDGSIDWLCLPRFDSPACFAALLGTPDNGRWLIAPRAQAHQTCRRYRGESLILETEFRCAEGAVAVIDFMPVAERPHRVDLVRIVEGRSGHVPMATELVLRFDYGHVLPWVRRRSYGISAIAGPDAVQIRAPIKLRGENFRSVAEFDVAEGQRLAFVMTRYDSHLGEPHARDEGTMLQETADWWQKWSQRCTIRGRLREPVIRSLITLKALTYSPTGAIVAAPTTSLPERLGGVRNWDYRYCWLRDATFTLYALLSAGYTEEARAWREWLLRAVAGHPQEMQIMYGLAGERRLPEIELRWLQGYEHSRPVRLGNAAHEQLQLDVYGEIMDVLHVAHRYGLPGHNDAGQLQRVLIDYLETIWEKPDEGIWEIRGKRRPFVHSRMMAWVAVDRAVKEIECGRMEGPLDKWRALRAQIHDDVCRHGFNSKRGAFVQYYGSDELDSALLMMPLVGFLPARDPRVLGTIEAIRRELMSDGLVRRYRTDAGIDGLPAGEAAFLPCTFWLADCLEAIGRHREAHEIFDRLLALRNDVGLLAEEYDPRLKRQMGNFPQAFSHIALVNSAFNLSTVHGPARHRAAHNGNHSIRRP
ncbi:MAG TPA: glycoside hydrolase family 15 protein [Candidatus Binataceae bacterium]|nr:glycoside hydrolase family 15 protein [Candidatus Binataceae bacterium]